MADAVLIYADSFRSADMRHAVPLGVPDPFLYAEEDGSRHVFASSMEATRLRELGLFDVHVHEELGYDELLDHRRVVRAVLDCTGGWYAQQEWAGVALEDLLAVDDRATSVEFASVTGYARRLPLADVEGLLLATHVAGEPLSSGHGFPVRLVAPGRRGFWWVKWVQRVSLSDTPWWWQLPFPAA